MRIDRTDIVHESTCSQAKCMDGAGCKAPRIRRQVPAQWGQRSAGAALAAATPMQFSPTRTRATLCAAARSCCRIRRFEAGGTDRLR